MKKHSSPEKRKRMNATFYEPALRNLGLLVILTLSAWGQVHAQSGTPTQVELPQASEIFDPLGWAEEQQFYKRRQEQLLAHIQGARNIEVAKGWQGVAPWPINWEAQQNFCHRIADVLFKEPHRLSFPEPSFAPYRDSAEKLRDVWSVPYPSCRDSRDINRYIQGLQKEYTERKLTGNYSPIGTSPRYYVDKNLLILEFRDLALRPPIGSAWGTQWQRSGEWQHIDMVSYDYRAGVNDKGCHLWGSIAEDYNWDRDDKSKVILTRMDDEYVFVEIGSFDKEHGVSSAKARAMGGWFSTPGKRYVTATGVNHNLHYTLMPESRRWKDGSEYNAPLNIHGVEQNWALPYAYACVINFDGPQGPQK